MKKEIQNVLLIQPPLPFNERHKKIVPLSIAYLASFLRQRIPKIRIQILDAHILNLSISETIKEVLNDPWDVIGITYWTLQASAAFAISKSIKSATSNTIIVHGGVHSTSMPEESTKYADFCVLHEGEETFFELIEALRENKDINEVKGIAFLKDGVLVKTPPRPFIEDLDTIPFPAWDLLPIEKYDTPFHIGGGKRMPVIGSRGCPYNCTFCVSPLMWKRKVRWRKPEYVVSEMEEILRRYQIDQIHFWDDNLMMNPEYVIGLCNEIIERKLKIKWIGLTRASHINEHPELLSLMKEAGCVGLEIGIESANPETYLKVRKGENLSDMELAFENQRKAGLLPLFTFMTFNPGETITGYYLQAKFIQKNVPMAKKYHAFEVTNPIAIGQFSTPHIGTQFRKEAVQLGLVLTDARDELFHHQINFLPYSLLNDIPERTTKKSLKIGHYLACFMAIKTWFAIFPSNSTPLIETLSKLKECIRFTKYFFSQCSGNLSIKRIAESASLDLGMDLKKSLGYSALICVALSQMGMIRSAVHHKDIPILPIKGINITILKLIWKFRLSKWLKRAFRIKNG
jgi:magnesium-protoporphyrin IX monomethyl ester (oxidative) cyclase